MNGYGERIKYDVEDYNSKPKITREEGQWNHAHYIWGHPVAKSKIDKYNPNVHIAAIKLDYDKYQDKS